MHIQELPPDSTLLAKAGLADHSPFEETLYLDIDTVVLGRLDHGFAQAARHGLACCINENPYARRHVGLRNQPDLIEYNTGVLFFTQAAAPIFTRWKMLANQVDSRIDYVLNGQVHWQSCNDQASFARAVEEVAGETGRFPFVLPINWNFRPRWHQLFFGELKIWHEYTDPPEIIMRRCREQTTPGTPMSFFAFTVTKA